MKERPCSILFIFILVQSSVRSSVLQDEPGGKERGTFEAKGYVPQEDHPGKRNLLEELFDTKQVFNDQDACMWRCQERCKNGCKNYEEEDEEEEEEGCNCNDYRRLKPCMRRCRNGDLDRPGREMWEETKKKNTKWQYI